MHTLLLSVLTTLQQATTNSRLHWRLLDTYGQVWVSLLWGHWHIQGFVCVLHESVSPVLGKFWWLYGGLNGDLLQEGLCHIPVCCTQSPYPCGSPLLTRTSTGDTQTQFCLSLCGVSGSWCAQGLSEPSGYCSHETKRCLLLGKKVRTNLDSILESRDIILPTKVRLVKALDFPVLMYGCESWTIKKAKCQTIDAFELCCWRKLLRVQWTARTFNQFILK